MAVWNPVPEEHVRAAVELGWAAIEADPTILDGVLRGYAAEDLAKARGAVEDRRPRVHLGYPLVGAHPAGIAVVAVSDGDSGLYLGEGGQDEEAAPGELRTVFRDRPAGSVALYVYVDNADVCLWWYRATRAVVNTARRHLRGLGLYSLKLAGTELAPQPPLKPGEVYLRRLTLSFEYEERWSDDSALWTAFYGGPQDERASTVTVLHEDQDSGGVHPFVPTLGG